MFKTLFLTLCFFISLSAHAQEIYQKEQSISLSKEEGLSWVKLCLSQYPEILWLADERVRKTEEGKGVLEGSYSELLFGKKFVEFDRTIMTLHCLKLILDGSDLAYQRFVQNQPEKMKLSKESFLNLHRQGRALLTSHFDQMSEEEMLIAMETALVLGDIGKSEKAREIFGLFGASAPDHDDFHEEALDILKVNPELSPSFERLKISAKKLILQTANLAHYGHITHIEGGPNMFSTLKNRGFVSSIALPFDFFIHTCDVAGALGHLNAQSSLVYTELTHRSMHAAFEACLLLQDPHRSEKDAYFQYLSQRAEWLGLNPKDPTQRTLARLGAMMRLFSLEEGALLKKAFLEIPKSLQEEIIQQLDLSSQEPLKRTPTYVPALFVNLAKERDLSEAVKLGLPFVANVLKVHKQSLKEKQANPSIPLNFNQVAGIVKTDPERLKSSFTIDAEGNVCILPKKTDHVDKGVF